MQNDDFSGDYIASRQTLAEDSAATALLRRYENRARTETNPAATEAPKATGKKEGGSVGAVASDIGRGIIDTPGAIVHGITDAVNETIDMTQELDEWITSKVGTVNIGGKDGLISYISPDEYAQGKRSGGIPDVPQAEWTEPESTTGKMVEGVAQFLTGFIGAGKLLKGVPAVGKTAKLAKATGQGAVADFTAFDPHEQRLSDLVQQFPALQNPVTEFLASSPDDSAATGRLKNALEGIGLGMVTEGLSKTLGVMKRVATTKRMQVDAARIAGTTEIPRPEIPDNAFAQLGDETQPVLAQTAEEAPDKVRPIDPNATPDQALSKSEPQTYINFTRINTPDDVKDVMQQMVDASKGEVDAARRGEKRTFAQMELDANHVNAWDTLMKRREGAPLNAEQSVAARQLWATSATKLSQLAKQAATTGSESDLFAFRKMMSVHQTIQAEVVAARTETARALASWRIPTGSGAERFMEVDNALAQNGGAELSREMAQRISTLADAGMIQEMDAVISKGAYAKSRDAFLEAWINGLLSGPKTHLVNAVSNTSVLFQQMYERKTAAKIAELLGDEGSVQMGEAMAQYSGMVNGFRDAVRFAGQTFKTGQTGFGLNKVELPTSNAISSEALGMSSQGFVGRAVDVIGSAVNIPTRSLAAADEFFKTIGYRMELNALAVRQAAQEAHGGLIPPEGLKARIAEIIENPPASVRLGAIDQAAYQTFTKKPGELAQLIQKAKGKYPGLNVILPFVRTPANIMNYTFERTPLAPLFKSFRADMAAGGARRDLALARMSTGTAIMMTVADMAMSDNITGKGPSNSAERQALVRTGWQPYSVKVGERYYAYNRMDPIGMTMGLSADMVDILANDEFGVEKQKEAEQVAIAVAMSIANNVMSKTYMSGVSDMVQAMADPERFGESFFQRLAGSVVPTGVAEIARGVDPYMRETSNMVEAMMKRTPGLSDELPVRRDLWGEPVGYQSGLGVMYDAFSPSYSKAVKPSPIDEEILKHEMNITMPAKKMGFDGISVDLEKYKGAYSRFLELAGKEVKHPAWGLTSKELLNEIVTGNHTLSQVYDMKSDGPDGGKYHFVRDILEQYREYAKTELLKEYPQIKDEADERKAKKRELKMPVFGG